MDTRRPVAARKALFSKVALLSGFLRAEIRTAVVAFGQPERRMPSTVPISLYLPKYEQHRFGPL